MAEAITTHGGKLRRFILEQHPVRGFWLRLDEAWRELRAFQRHAPCVEDLLGQAVSAATLLAATLKFQGTLSLQLQGDGLVKLLVAQCTHEFEIRAVARAEESIPPSATFRELVGNGRLSVSIEAGAGAGRYEGIVALDGIDFASCLERYFEVSEQLPTRILLMAEATRASGLLLQKMPLAACAGEARSAELQSTWEDLRDRLELIDAPLLQLGTAEEVLQRLCGEHDCRLFLPHRVRFACRCSNERVTGLLRSLGGDELRSILAEQGAVRVTCEFCGRPYHFDAVDVARLLADGAGLQGSKTVN